MKGMKYYKFTLDKLKAIQVLDDLSIGTRTKLRNIFENSTLYVPCI